MSKIYDTDNLIEGYRDSMIADLSRLIAHPSVSGAAEEKYPFGKPCGEVLDEFSAIAEQHGFKAANLDYYAGFIDIDPTKPTELAVLAHLDVVPVRPEDWSSDPFKAEVRDGKIFGRGAIDDKGPVIAALYAMKAVKESGVELEKNVRLIVGCSEETGSEKDIEYYCEHEKMPPQVMTPDADFPIITTEKGMARVFFEKKITEKSMLLSFKGGTVVNAVPAKATARIAADKDIIKTKIPQNITVSEQDGTLILEATGVAAHAMSPQLGDNAITMLLEFLAANDCFGTEIKQLSELFPYGVTGGEPAGIYRIDDSGETTCVLSVLEIADGSISGKIDMRLPLAIKASEAAAAMCSKLLAAGFIASAPIVSEAHDVDKNSEFVQTLLKVYTEKTGLEGYCKSTGGGTYVHAIEGGVAFGVEFPDEKNNMHSADEFFKISSLLITAKIYAEAIIRLCGKK